MLVGDHRVGRVDVAGMSCVQVDSSRKLQPLASWIYLGTFPHGVEGDDTPYR
jgi:hypothetical protein